MQTGLYLHLPFSFSSFSTCLSEILPPSSTLFGVGAKGVHSITKGLGVAANSRLRMLFGLKIKLIHQISNETVCVVDDVYVVDSTNDETRSLKFSLADLVVLLSFWKPVRASVYLDDDVPLSEQNVDHVPTVEHDLVRVERDPRLSKSRVQELLER